MEDTIDLSMRNYYDSELVQQFMPNPQNPNYNLHNIKVPFRIIVNGGSGTMKSNATLNLIRIMNNTFNKCILFTACKDEPLYNSLAVILGEQLTIYEGLEELQTQDINKMFPNPDNQEDDREATLIIFDDLC